MVYIVQTIMGMYLPSIEGIYKKRCREKVVNIIKDPQHPGHVLVMLLPSETRYRVLTTITARFKSSFSHQH